MRACIARSIGYASAIAIASRLSSDGTSAYSTRSEKIASGVCGMRG
jgi:hypothetical protein